MGNNTGGDGLGPGSPSMPTLQAGDVTFTYTPSTPTNGSVTVTISTTIPEYTLQYSINAGATWQDYTTGIVCTTAGQVIYVRLTDGTNVTNVASGNVTNIDKTNPVVGTVTPSVNSVTFNATDVGSRNKRIWI